MVSLGTLDDLLNVASNRLSVADTIFAISYDTASASTWDHCSIPETKLCVSPIDIRFTVSWTSDVAGSRAFKSSPRTPTGMVCIRKLQSSTILETSLFCRWQELWAPVELVTVDTATIFKAMGSKLLLLVP